MVETVPIQMPDGTTTPVRLFPGPEGAPVVVIVPGLGIPGAFYDRFANSIVDHGFCAATCELRGQGDSRPRPSASSAFGYQEWCRWTCRRCSRWFGSGSTPARPFLLGHSMGGQLGVMYAARIRGRLGGLILVASGSPYYRGFPGTRSPACCWVRRPCRSRRVSPGSGPGPVGRRRFRSAVAGADLGLVAVRAQRAYRAGRRGHRLRGADRTAETARAVDFDRGRRPGTAQRVGQPFETNCQVRGDRVAPTRTVGAQRVDKHPGQHGRSNRGVDP
ncbi:alpha/beta fold hydrolase [Rhodococcus hoagii]|nr:alpha/beta fold hydrolase [Prescottella equi]